jgi:hypothetical protein
MGAQAEEAANTVNLYRWHEDPVTHATAITFLATLAAPESGVPQDEADWRDSANLQSESSGPSGGQRSSRLNPSGAVLLFSSVARLTTYENLGHVEFYRYDSSAASGKRLTCVTCNPTGAPATDSAFLASDNESLTAKPTSRNAFLTRNLSADGSRAFFQTEEALLPADTNGALDVYEWEAAGHRSCTESSATFSAASGGCLYLLSTGLSPQQSYFADASENGEDAFFFTRQPLISQDTDDNSDLYDAREAGGIAAQNPPPVSPPCAGEACRPLPAAPPGEQSVASAIFSGPGNRRQSHRNHHRRKKHHKRHGRANRNRGGHK